jgi:hypothetical protein
LLDFKEDFNNITKTLKKIQKKFSSKSKYYPNKQEINFSAFCLVSVKIFGKKLTAFEMFIL